MFRFVYLFVFPILFAPIFFRVKEISCLTDADQFCPPYINLLFDKLKGKPYFRVKNEIYKILEGNRMITSCKFRFVFPSKLFLNISFQNSSFVLKDASSNFYVVDGDGYVLERKDKVLDNSFVEIGNLQLNVGDRISDKIIMPMMVFYHINYLYRINYAKIFPDRFEIKLLSGPLFILPLEGKDTEYLVGAIRFLNQKLEEDTRIFKLDKSYDNITIDLRYENPVLR